MSELEDGDRWHETRERFLEIEANHRGTTVDGLAELGIHAEPCDCNAGKCPGWQMVTSVDGHPI